MTERPGRPKACRSRRQAQAPPERLGVLDGDEAQALCGGRLGQPVAIGIPEALVQLGGLPAALADGDEHPDERAHHLVAERVGLDLEHEQGRFRPPARLAHTPPEWPRLAPLRLTAEGGEVVLPVDRLGREAHRRKVELAGEMPARAR